MLRACVKELPPLRVAQGDYDGESSQDLTPQTTRKPNTQNRAPVMRILGQPALKVEGLVDGNKWTWAVNAAPTAAAVRDERTCDVTSNAANT